MGRKQLLWLPVLAVPLVTILAAGGVCAQDWNHEANIESAVEAVVAVHRAGGMDAAIVFIGDCYRSVDGSEASDQQLQRLEYCAGMDFAAFLLGRQTQAASAEAMPPFFAAQAMFERMQRLDRWVRDPATNHQILRAWAASAAQSLTAQQRD